MEKNNSKARGLLIFGGVVGVVMAGLAVIGVVSLNRNENGAGTPPESPAEVAKTLGGEMEPALRGPVPDSSAASPSAGALPSFLSPATRGGGSGPSSGGPSRSFNGASAGEQLQTAKSYLSEGIFEKGTIDPETGEEVIVLEQEDIEKAARALVAMNEAISSGVISSSSGSGENETASSSATPGGSVEEILEGLGFEATEAILTEAVRQAEQSQGVEGAFELVLGIKNLDLRQDATQVLAGELLESHGFDETSELFQKHLGWPKQNADGVISVKARKLGMTN